MSATELSLSLFTRDLAISCSRASHNSMPYTPPSQRSPAVSSTPSPSVSRTNSYIKPSEYPIHNVGYNSGPRPGLPRSSSSTSYLNRERRSPQAPRHQNLSPDLTPVLEKQSTINNGFKNPQQSGSLRQSPPPVNNSIIPTGAVISPPDSTQNSSDDEEASEDRHRRLDNLEVEELKSAISAIEQRRAGSPDRSNETGKPKLSIEVTTPSPQPLLHDPFTLPREGRHSRSDTDSCIDYSRSSDSPEGSSEDDDLEMARSNKPPMLRKKSGELVKPALRPAAAKRRPSSMPGTPTYNKNVHFDNQLEHVRTFLQIDRPAAVSAGSSPVDPYDSETEFPFGETISKRESPWEWEIKTPNFPTSSDRKHQPVRVERLFLSGDKKFLVCSVIVKNLAFHKSVVTRFTLDYWKTTSEVAAEFSHDIHKDIEEGSDRFMFSINLTDQTNLESKTLFFCVRYNVNGEEFWDSNSMMNFQVEFSKKNIPQKAKNGLLGSGSKSMTSLSSLPRSTKQRPVKLPTFDDFADVDGPFNLGSPPTAASLIGGEKPLRFRQKPNTSGTQSKPTQAFGNRYDIGASLSATKNGSPTFSDLRPTFASGTKPEGSSMTLEQKPEQPAKPIGEAAKIATLSEKPSLQSQSYNDLINKYCFVRSSDKLTGR